MEVEGLKERVLFYCRNDINIDEIEDLKIMELVKLIKKVEYKNDGRKILNSKLESDEKLISLYYELNKMMIKENGKKWNREHYRNMDEEKKKKYIEVSKKNMNKTRSLNKLKDMEKKNKEYINKLFSKIGIE